MILSQSKHCNKYWAQYLFKFHFRELRYRYTITNIPNIVVVKNDGTVITANGRKEVEDIGVNVLVTWTE